MTVPEKEMTSLLLLQGEFFLITRLKNLWYFVFKIVLTYCEKEIVLVIENNFEYTKGQLTSVFKSSKK